METNQLHRDAIRPTHSPHPQEDGRFGYATTDSQSLRAGAVLKRPLCLRYAFAEFKTLHLPVRDGDAAQHVPWHWALGLFMQDKYEILGAWPGGASAGQIANDLHERGVERIKAITVGCSIELTSPFLGAVMWPVASGSRTVSTSAAGGAFGPRSRASFQSAILTAEGLQKRLEASIRRQGPFADEAAAVAFLTLALERADRRFFEVPKPRLLTSPRAAIASSGGLTNSPS